MMKLSRYGEDGIRIVFGETIDSATHEEVRRYFFSLKSLAKEGIREIIPSFHTILISFDEEKIPYDELSAFLIAKEHDFSAVEIPEPVLHEIPAFYGGDYGPDMDFVSSYSGLSAEEIIEIHSSTIYTVFAVGFMPGFPYLGVLDKRLYVPRLDTPRTKVAEGSIGLAQLQTGIYSFESPGGWRIIGRTDRELFDARKAPYSLLQMGDRVRFIRI
jgi:inhibitor of KinA